MLKQDAHFRMGQAHKVCEDYALHGSQPFPWLILCDGCSSSGRTDVGARLLALSAARLLQNYTKMPDYSTFGAAVIKAASAAAAGLGLHSSCLDATLLLAVQQGESVSVLVYGDGHLLLKHVDGNIHLISIEFKGNAPYYLSYLLHAENQRAYAETFADPNILLLHNDLTQSTQHLRYDTPLLFNFRLAEFPLIGIASDGLSSFLDTSQQKLLPAQQIAAILLDFQNFHEDFVQRRLHKSLLRLAQKDIYPLDDLSMGVFSFAL